jgi:hypothetical protein
MNDKLEVSDILDLREYERGRTEYRSRIIELKRSRRVSVGEFITFLFENRETVRFQVQEMARAERMLSDEEIQAELDVYNPLIPLPGELSATMFIELTTKGDLEYWLPRLVGVEDSVLVEVGSLSVKGELDPEHREQLSRSDVTASVHYLKFQVGIENGDRFLEEPVYLRVEHPAYKAAVEIPIDTKLSLLKDWSSS